MKGSGQSDLQDADLRDRDLRLRDHTVPRTVWWVLGLHTFLLLFGSVAMPLLSVPDETHHADMVWAVSEGMGWPEPGERAIGPEVAAAGRMWREGIRTEEGAVPRGSDTAVQSNCSGRPLPVCSHRPTAQDLRELDLHSGRVNRASQHPPLYYAITSGIGNGAAALLPADGPLAFEDQLWIYRVVSALWVVPLPLVAALIAKRLGGTAFEQSLASVLTLISPSFYLRTASMINNDAPTILLVSTLVLLAVTIIQSGWERFRWIAFGGVLGVALLIKGLALPLVLLVPMTCLGRAIRVRRLSGGNVLAGFSSVVLASLIGGWWWLRNLYKYDRVQPLVFEPGDPVPQGLGDVPVWAGEWFVNTFRSFWGSWFIPAYGPTFWLLLVVVAVTVMLALWLRPLRVEVLLTIAVGALLIGGVMLVSLNRFLGSGLVKGDQGRYLFPVLAASAAVAALAWSRKTPRVVNQGRLMAGVLLMLAVVHIGSWGRFSRTQWGQPGAGFRDQWDALVAWAPIRHELVYAIVAGLVLGFAAVSISALRESRSDVPNRTSPR